MNILAPLLITVTLVSGQQSPQTATHAQEAWNATLMTHVNPEGKVNYEGIINDDSSLLGYIDWLEKIDLEAMNSEEKLSTLINAYNAFTILLITEHWPIDSIKDISSKYRWRARRWHLGGKIVSLDDIEHTMIRPVFEQPLIHFALVCGAKGCPPLRSGLYLSSDIVQQLKDQAQKTHDSKNWYRYDRSTNTIYITKLYKWYKSDFVKKKSTIQQFVAHFDPLIGRAIQTNRTPTIRYLPYDWKINNWPSADLLIE